MTYSRSLSRAAGLLAFAALSTGSPVQAQGMNTTSMGHEVVVDGLEIPWDIAFLPDANLGVVVLSNRGNADNFTRSVREYVFELGFGLEHEADSRYRATQAAADAALEEILRENQFAPVEQEQAMPYVGEYDMGLSVSYDEANGFALDTEYGDVSLVAVVGREDTFYARNGLILTFSRDSDDGVTLSIGLLDDPLQTVVLQKRAG